MTILITDTGGEVAAYSPEGRLIGRFAPEDFYLNVLSPRDLRLWEKNPDRRRFEVRKIDFNNHKK
jgi:hypothetical protein